MLHILISMSTPQRSAVETESCRDDVDPQQQQMVAGFLVAVCSAVNRAAECACRGNKITPEALEKKKKHNHAAELNPCSCQLPKSVPIVKYSLESVSHSSCFARQKH